MKLNCSYFLTMYNVYKKWFVCLFDVTTSDGICSRSAAQLESLLFRCLGVFATHHIHDILPLLLCIIVYRSSCFKYLSSNKIQMMDSRMTTGKNIYYIHEHSVDKCANSRQLFPLFTNIDCVKMNRYYWP